MIRGLKLVEEYFKGIDEYEKKTNKVIRDITISTYSLRTIKFDLYLTNIVLEKEVDINYLKNDCNFNADKYNVGLKGKYVLTQDECDDLEYYYNGKDN